MEKSTYDYINNYCTEKYDGILVQAERDYVLRKFLDSYYSSIQTFINDNGGRNPTDAEEKALISSLMNNNTMNSFIDSAKAYYTEYKAEIENDYQKKVDKPAFWKNVGSSVLGSFIYSILLAIIFWVGKDQIGAWLMSLTK